jgi:Fe(3+) dicitrate transport protein
MIAILCLLQPTNAYLAEAAQNVQIKAIVLDKDKNMPIKGIKVIIPGINKAYTTNKEGSFSFLWACMDDSIQIRLQGFGYKSLLTMLACSPGIQYIYLQQLQFATPELIVKGNQEQKLGAGQLESVQEAAIYEAKKTELIIPDLLNANRSANMARQIFARVAGLNIWESDQAGLQLGIGGRGLSPNRTSNFNTRQNGCDMSADALGYPESYYTPPIEAVDRIEIVRGAASLQYGTQFGGMLNFKMKRGPEHSPLTGLIRLSGGMYGFASGFASAGGQTGDLNYYSMFSYKRGDGWRQNSDFEAYTAYASLHWQAMPQLEISADYTYSHALAHQPGGLTDRGFEQDARQSIRSRNWFLTDWNIATLTLHYQPSTSFRINSRSFTVFARRASLGNLERINVLDLGGNRTMIDGRFVNVGNETRFLWTDNIFDRPANLIMGFRLYHGDSQQQQGDADSSARPHFSYLNPDRPGDSDYQNPGDNAAAFAELVLRPLPGLSIVPGIRAEYISTASMGYYVERVRDLAGNPISEVQYNENRQNNRSLVLLGIGSAYQMDEDMEIYANFSQNYRAITYSDLRVLNPNFRIDSNIADETGYNADLGLRGSMANGLIYMDISAFYLRYANRIGVVLRDDIAPLFLPYRFRTNIGASSTIGLECIIEADIWKLLSDNALTEWSLNTFVNLSVLSGYYTSSTQPGITGKEVEQVPPFTIRTGATVRNGFFSATVQYSSIGRHFTDATNAIRTSTAVNGLIPAYSIMDFSARFQYSKSIALECNINNLLDARYFTRRAESYPGPGIIPADALNASITLEIKL